MIKVILTAIGCPGGPSIIQALRDDPSIYIIGTDIRGEMVGKYLVDEFYQVPAGKSEEFIPAMLALVEKTNADLILPLATFELLNLAQHIHSFESLNCKVCVSEYESLLIANDRRLLFETFEDLNLSPEYRLLKHGDELESLAEELGYPEEKVAIKPFISHGSIGLRILDSSLDLYDQFRNKKPTNVHVPLELAKSIFKDRKLDDIILTEFLPGQEFGVDMLIHPETHEIIYAMPRDNGEVFHSEILNGKSIQNDILLGIAQNVAKKLKLAYTINIDVKMDKNKNYKILEINPRLPATAFLAYSVGINLPLFSIYLALGKELPKVTIQENRHIFSYRGFVVTDEMGKIKYKAL